MKISTHGLIRQADAGRLSVVMKDGAPLFIAVPFDTSFLTEDVMTVPAMRLSDEECVSFGWAARMAGLSVGDMTDKFSLRGVAVIRTNAEELQRSLIEFSETRSR